MATRNHTFIVRVETHTTPLGTVWYRIWCDEEVIHDWHRRDGRKPPPPMRMAA